MKKIMIIAFAFLFSLMSYQVFACTVFYVARGNMVLAGNNEDFINAEAYIQFLPAEQGKHGRIYFGFCYEVGKIAPFGGVNDQGLFFNTVSLDPIKLDKPPKGEIYKGNIIEKILEVKLNSLYTRNIAAEGFVNWKNGELADKIKTRQAKNISSNITDDYVGKYKITFYNTNDSLEVIKEAGKLYILAQDTLKIEILPESETKFFIATLNGDIEFTFNKVESEQKILLHIKTVQLGDEATYEKKL